MTQVISPTPGRIVWYYPSENDGIGRLNGQPLAAIVAGVHNDNLVNLAVFDAYGNSQQRSSVHLVQPGEDVPNNAHATWMPYQINAAGITAAEVPSADMFAETDGTSASETGLVTDDAAPSSSEPTGENTEAPAA